MTASNLLALEGIRCEESEGIATITLDRPGKRNAIDMAMRISLLAALTHIQQTPEIQAVIITGAGGHFCGGGDIAAMQSAELDATAGLARMQPVIACARLILELGKPVIAAVDGCAYGGGLGLALCSDLLLVTPGARLSCSFMKVGLVPDFLTSFTLPRIVGWQQAKQLAYSAREVSGDEAMRLGIAAEQVHAEALATRAREVALALSTASSSAFAMTKSLLLRSLSADLATMAQEEAMAQAICLSTDWNKAALRQAQSKKKPLYEGYGHIGI